MKATSLFCLTGIAFTSGLMADEAQIRVEIVPQPEIAVCEEAPNPAMVVKELKAMVANEESIESILKNEETETVVEKLNAPIILKSMEEANQHLTRVSMEKIADVVDFERQQVAIFAWQGSSQDRLDGKLVAGDDGATQFEYSIGWAKELKRHSTIYLMPKNTKLAAVKVGRQAGDRCGGARGFEELRPGELELMFDLKVDLKVEPEPKAE